MRYRRTLPLVALIAAGRTLALNVVVRGEPDRVRRALEDRSGVDWTATEGDAEAPVEGVDGVDESPWRPARGAARHTYVTPDRDAPGEWGRAVYQLSTGTYLGSRVHVRAYPAPSENWTALQAHVEYWDPFRLRHTVTGVAEGGRFVERDLRDEPFVDGVSREYHGLDGGGSHGWLTVVELAPAALVLGAALPVAGRYREYAVDAALPAALVALVLGIRAAGLAAEGLAPGVDPGCSPRCCTPYSREGSRRSYGCSRAVGRRRGRRSSPGPDWVPPLCSTWVASG